MVSGGLCVAWISPHVAVTHCACPDNVSWESSEELVILAVQLPMVTTWLCLGHGYGYDCVE